MMQLSNLQLKNLLPPVLLNDETVAGLCDAFQIELDQIVAEIVNILFLPRVDNLSGNILEHLAWGLNIEGDEGWLLADTDVKKRDLIKNAVAIQRNKGTKFAVQKALELVGLSATIEEWYEYGGAPYNFRIIIDGAQSYTPEQLNLLDRYVVKNKNVRSWAETTISSELASDIYVATAAVIDDEVTIYPQPYVQPELDALVQRYAVVFNEHQSVEFKIDLSNQKTIYHAVAMQDYNVIEFVVNQITISGESFAGVAPLVSEELTIYEQ